MADSKEALNLVVIGPKHAGKTVYLTTLANSPEVSLSDPATIEVVSMHWKTMQQGDIPPATAGTISKLDFSFHCEIDSQEYNIDFTVPDYDGHFAETLSQGNADSPDRLRLREIISRADGFIVFMPLGDDDNKTMESMRHEIGSFIGILREVFDEDSKIPAPLIIAVNKWAKSPDFKSENEDAAALRYIESIDIYKKLYEQLKNYFGHVTVIALSAYGHRTDSARPQPGKMEPYRVTDPVMLVVRDYFENLHNTVDSLKNDSAKLAELLLATRPLWKRWPGGDYDTLLDTTLGQCFNELKTQLEQAQNLKEYRHILQQAPQARLLPYYSPTQQIEIEHIGEPHSKKEKTRRAKIGGIGACAILLACSIWYLVQLNLDIQKAYHDVMTAEIQKQPQMLSDFIAKYGSGPISRFVASGELEQAKEKLRQEVETLQEDLDKRLAMLGNEGDSCQAAAEARQLLAVSENLSDSVSAQTMRRLETIFQTNEEICAARSAIEAASDEASLEQAFGLLANKPETAEVIKLKELAGAKKSNFEAQVAQARESERISPIAEQFRELPQASLEEVKKFISDYEYDSNSEVGSMVSKARAMLPQSFYADILIKLRDISDPNSQAFSELRRFIAENIQDIELTPSQKANIQQAVGEMMVRYDQNAINALPTRIDTQQELENALNAANEIASARDVSLDGGLFHYSMPPALAREWANKANALKAYIDAVQNGVYANWTLLAASNNAVELDCENLIARDARLTISFYGGSLPDQNATEGTLRCKRMEGNNYEFYFSGRVTQFNGTVRLTKNRLIRSNLSCTAGLVINANDLITLQNGLPVTKSLSNNCPGTSIRFTRSGR